MLRVPCSACLHFSMAQLCVTCEGGLDLAAIICNCANDRVPMTSLTELGWQIRQGCQPRLPRQQDSSVRCRCSMQAWLTAVLVKTYITCDRCIHQIHSYVGVPCMGPKPVLQATLPAAGCSHVLQERAPGKGKTSQNMDRAFWSWRCYYWYA
jgi:hypothetical protein